MAIPMRLMRTGDDKFIAFLTRVDVIQKRCLSLLPVLTVSFRWLARPFTVWGDIMTGFGFGNRRTQKLDLTFNDVN